MMLLRGTAGRAGVFAAAVTIGAVLLAACSGSATPNAVPATTLTVSPSTTGGVISPLLLGANGHWHYDDFGAWNPQTQANYPGYVRVLHDSDVSSIRYPAGTAANLFHWEQAIGPQSARTGQVGQTHGFPDHALDSQFGPDEYGRLLEAEHQAGSIVANFSTGTPQEAADWVEYMTGKVGANLNGGIDWAAVRARNGHPAPYDVPYWEVGNEMHSGHQLYWRAGSSPKDTTELYALGGSTHFTKQRVGTHTDYNDRAAVSSGRAGQTFAVKYAPVANGSDRVYVGAQQWQRVTSMSDAGAGQHVYTLDDKTGALRFGDGTHGAVPPKSAVITISYTSGPHAGFDAFYAAMKKANPDVHVCASMNDVAATTEFTKLMGSTHPYDCLERHAYINNNDTKIPSDVDPATYHDEVMSHVAEQVDSVRQVQHAVTANAGSRAKDVKVVVTEYGQLGGNPKSDPNFHQSLSEAILMGDDLAAWIKLGIPLADKANLNGFGDKETTGIGAQVGKNADSMIDREGSTFFLQSTGLVPQLVAPLTGGRLSTSTISGNPTRPVPGGKTLSALTSVASRTSDGGLEVLVINQDPAHSVTTRVAPGLTHRTSATVSTLNGPSITSRNTRTSRPVAVHTSTEQVGSGSFTHTFPAHSITRIRLDQS